MCVCMCEHEEARMKRKSYHLNVEVLRAQHFSQALHYVLMDVTTSNRSQHPPYCVCVYVCVCSLLDPHPYYSLLSTLYSQRNGRKLAESILFLYTYVRLTHITYIHHHYYFSLTLFICCCIYIQAAADYH